MTVMRTLHSELELYQVRDAVVIAPTEGSGAAIKIKRETGDIAFISAENVPHTLTPPKRIFGIAGLLHLSLDQYLIAITENKRVCRLLSHDVFQATRFELIPIRLTQLTMQNDPEETSYINLIQILLNTYRFYYSYSLDITNSIQRSLINENDPTLSERPLWANANDLFFFNKFASKALIDAIGKDFEGSRFILPMIMGFFECRDVRINDAILRLIIVSRRARYRNGTRLFSRGIDDLGQTSNFNGTEQITVIEKRESEPQIFAFNQIRGSIPLKWHHILDFTRKPGISLQSVDRAVKPATQHFRSQIEDYAKVHIVNLIADSDKYEENLKKGFEELIQRLDLPQLHYHYFNFNKECAHMQWQNLSKLIERLEPVFEEQQYFSAVVRKKPVITRKQEGIFRTNCLDSLDRTGVVQSNFARKVLTDQMRQAGIISEYQRITDFPLLENSFRNIWADNADEISKIYSGTAALKSGYTRTGKRSLFGVLNDGRLSLMRYCRAYIFDWKNQDAFDLFLGAYAINGPKQDVPPLPEYRIFKEIGQIFAASVALWIFANSVFAKFSIAPALKKVAFVLFSYAIFQGTRLFVNNKTKLIYFPRLLRLDHSPAEVIKSTGSTLPSGKSMEREDEKLA